MRQKTWTPAPNSPITSKTFSLISSIFRIFPATSKKFPTFNRQFLNFCKKLKKFNILQNVLKFFFRPGNQWNEQNTNNEPERSINPQIKKAHYCNCKKTKCLKLYCECFAIGEVCDSNCCCHDCSNTNNNALRHNTIEQILSKDPQAFNAKIEASANKKINRRGCTCRKTNCLKKYCECYHAGIPCSEFCKCDHCKNNEFFIKESAFKKLAIVTPLKEDENKSEDTIDTSYKKNGLFLGSRNSYSPELWLSEPRKQRKMTNKNGKQEESNGKIIIEKSLIF